MQDEHGPRALANDEVAFPVTNIGAALGDHESVNPPILPGKAYALAGSPGSESAAWCECATHRR